jgi:hypothetical protein
VQGDDVFLDAVARWANLSLEERIADRLAAILLAADEIRDMVSLAGQPSARLADVLIERDPELELMLVQLDAELSRSQDICGMERETWWEQIDKRAAPCALAFYYEIRRLDRIRIWRTSFAPEVSGTESQ